MIDEARVYLETWLKAEIGKATEEFVRRNVDHNRFLARLNHDVSPSHFSDMVDLAKKVLRSLTSRAIAKVAATPEAEGDIRVLRPPLDGFAERLGAELARHIVRMARFGGGDPAARQRHMRSQIASMQLDLDTALKLAAFEVPRSRFPHAPPSPPPGNEAVGKALSAPAKLPLVPKKEIAAWLKALGDEADSLSQEALQQRAEAEHPGFRVSLSHIRELTSGRTRGPLRFRVKSSRN